MKNEERFYDQQFIEYTDGFTIHQAYNLYA